MRFADAEPIVRATLYEGYVLYPYRPSSVKNQQRWSFGGLEPRGGRMQTECLVRGTPETLIEVRVRFLHLGDRDGWHEAVEREVRCPARTIAALASAASLRFEFVPDAGLPMRQEPVHGEVRCTATEVAGGFRVRVVVENCSDAGALRLLSSVHVLLGVEGGAFLSMTDPPQAFAAEAATCKNEGCWPVLIGKEGASDLVLASPIILYDHPKVAPESPGDLFDATEIDEILSLRILTMTDGEKAEACRTDPRIAALITRTEALTQEDLLRLHGALRKDARPLRVGDRVRLRPRERADAIDVLLAGRTATIIGLERDVEDRVYVTVTIDDDPGSDLGLDGRPGHRFFYYLHEVEPL